MYYNFSGFIWSPGKKFVNEILEYINKDFPVLHYYEFRFNDEELFEKSILEIYTTDDIDPIKVKNIKIKNMINHGLSYVYFKFYIKDENYRKKSLTNNNISQTVESLKRYIRNKYKDNIQNYVHDILIHIADNNVQTNQIDHIINNNYITNITNEFINLKYLLTKNIKDNLFNRCDMIIRKIAVEKYIQNKNFNFDLYMKMQRIRKRFKFIEYSINCRESFKNLIDNINENGYDINYPIHCCNNYNLINGSHRLSICYYKKMLFIPIKRVKYYNIMYSIKWFENKNFSDEELKLLNTKLLILNNYISN